MTKVLFRKYYDNILFEIEGHSGFSQVGSDIVCAGISILVCTLLNAFHDEEAGGNLKFIRTYVGDGVVSFEVKAFDFSQKRIDAMVDFVMLGFYTLEENYPDYIRIE